MARRVLVLVVVLIAIAGSGLVLGEPPKAAPGASASTPAAESPDTIGPIDDDPAGPGGDDDVVEGPVGGPTPLGEYASATAPTGASDAENLKISAGIGGAAVVLAGFFF